MSAEQTTSVSRGRGARLTTTPRASGGRLRLDQLAVDAYRERLAVSAARVIGSRSVRVRSTAYVHDMAAVFRSGELRAQAAVAGPRASRP